MSNNINHQDWETVILKKKTSNKLTKVSDYERMNGANTIQVTKLGAAKNNQGNRSQQMSKVQRDALDNDGLSKKIPTIDRKISQNIQQARQKSGMTRKELAQKVNQTMNVIADYENGKAIPNAQLINKMERVLKTKLR